MTVRRLLALVALLALLSTACTKLVEEEPTPTPLATPSDANKPIYTAKKASIVEEVKGLGRVAATDEATMYFNQTGRLKSIKVELNQPVKKGDLVAELETGTLDTQLQQAQINSDIAQLALRRAVEKNNTVDPTVKTAASQVSQAEAAKAQSVANLQKLMDGAQPADVAAAQASVADARAKLEAAQTNLAKLTQPQSADELAAARGAADKAKAALQAAQAAYDKVGNRSDASASPQAVALQQATADYQAAQAKLQAAQQGPSPSDVAAAQQAVKSAQDALTAATARQQQVQAGPQAADVAAAQAAIQNADANISTARANYDQKVADAGLATTDYDVKIAQKQVELADVQLKTLQQQFDDSRLIAPFDGIVIDTNGREGDLINAYTPVVVVANPSSTLVSVELNQDDLKKVKVGQDATIKLDNFKGQTFQTKVIGLPETGNGPLPESLKRTVKLTYTAPTAGVDLGTLVNVAITTQKKDDVLTIPNAAVRRFGGRKYVQTVDANGRKREVDIETGIQTDTETEITKGITEGTRVVSQ